MAPVAQADLFEVAKHGDIEPALGGQWGRSLYGPAELRAVDGVDGFGAQPIRQESRLFDTDSVQRRVE
ncbi:unannotated protein [freshwater metagenome]|uniref:Unannotated protein n=1 Tax=freshwater metagenome TaxID=449393 RepID=A0A6J7PMF6_9ZZZZ